MSKPIITYMRKKNQTSRQLGDSQATSDSRTLHNKRSRAQSIAHKSLLSTKKLRISEDESQFQTPYPTALTESQIFKLPASNVPPLSPDHQFSPVPLAPKNKNASSSGAASKRRAYMRSSNKFLKENAIGRSSALVASDSSSRSHFQPRIIAKRPDMAESVHPKTLATRISGINLTGASIDGTLDELASPFSSRPSSPCASPGKTNIIGPALKAVHSTLRTTNDSCGLNSSCTFNTSESLFSRSVRTQAQSTTTSPVKSPHLSTLNDEPPPSASLRRPSAPTASRPRLDTWARFLPQVSDSGPHKDRSEPLERDEGMCASPHKLATEQPQQGCLEPSLLSLPLQKRDKWIWTDAAVDFNRPPSQLSFNLDFFNDAQGASTPLRGVTSSRETHLVSEDSGKDREIGSRSPFVSPFGRLMGELEDLSWVTDSLISPPSEYRRRKGVNSLNGSRNLETADGVDDDDNDDFSGCLHDPLIEETSTGPSHTIQAQTFEDINLAIRAGNLSVKDKDDMPEVPDRTSINEIEIKKVTVTKEASDSSSKPQHTGRIRRGTIRASDHVLQPPKVGQARRNRSGTIVGPSAARRTRSGTIIGPVSNIKTAPGGVKTRQISIIPVDEKAKSSSSISSASDAAVMEGDDDPINLFKEEWVDEDWPWAVADPPSPIATRTRNGNAKALRQTKCMSLNKKLTVKHVQVGIVKNCDDSSDDELLLK